MRPRDFFIKPFGYRRASIPSARSAGQQKSRQGRLGSQFCRIDINPAGNGNRTRMASLEGWNFTIKLCPRDLVPVRLGLNCREPVLLPSDFSRGGGGLIFPSPGTS